MAEEEESKYPALKKYLEDGIYDDPEEDNGKLFLTEWELDNLVGVVLNEIDHRNNVGIRHERINHTGGSSWREKAFHEEWLKQNKPDRSLNHGKGILQDLFIEFKITNSLHEKRMIFDISKRERVIVATVIQWLGSNIGFSFLEKVLNKAGYKITKIEK